MILFNNRSINLCQTLWINYYVKERNSEIIWKKLYSVEQWKIYQWKSVVSNCSCYSKKWKLLEYERQVLKIPRRREKLIPYIVLSSNTSDLSLIEMNFSLSFFFLFYTDRDIECRDYGHDCELRLPGFSFLFRFLAASDPRLPR